MPGAVLAKNPIANQDFPYSIESHAFPMKHHVSPISSVGIIESMRAVGFTQPHPMSALAKNSFSGALAGMIAGMMVGIFVSSGFGSGLSTVFITICSKDF